MHRTGVLMTSFWLFACSAEPPTSEKPVEAPPSAIMLTSGNGHEGELFGNILGGGPRSSSPYSILLVPDAQTAQRIAQELPGRWTAEFSISGNTGGGERDFEWFDPFGGPECLPGSTQTEIHGGGSGLEGHCIIPGHYTLQLDSGSTLIRSIPILYMGRLRDSVFEMLARDNTGARRALANQDLAYGSLGFFAGTNWGKYVGGDLRVDLDVSHPSNITEVEPSFIIENVGASPHDTFYVALNVSSGSGTVGPNDYVRIDASATAGTSPYDGGQRLVRVWVSDASGQRALTDFFWQAGGYEHLYSVPIAATTGCPQVGVETLLPHESPTSTPVGIHWQPLTVYGRCATPSRPDLGVAFTSLPTSLPSSGQAAASFTVSNAGPAGVTVAPRWELFLSKDGTLDVTDPSVASGYANALAAGGNQSIQTTFTVTNLATTPGGYNLIAAVDYYRTTEERRESDNIVASGGIPVASPPDLAIYTSSNPTVTLGQTVSFSYGIQNAGGASAVAPWLERLYMSPDGSLSRANDTLIHSFRELSNLASFANRTRLPSVTIPSTWNVGTRHLIIAIDDSAQVSESNENNNTPDIGYVYITYATGKDLAPLDGVGTYASGHWTGFQMRYRNIGQQSVSCGFVKFRYYLSVDTVLSADDFKTFAQLGCPSNSGEVYTTGLGPMINLLGPWGTATPSGTYYFFVKVDSEDGQAESNENNNVFRWPNQVVIGGGSFP